LAFSQPAADLCWRHNFSNVQAIMEPHTEKFNEATYNRPEGTRTLDAPVLRINLPDYARQIKNEAAWQNGDRNAITLLHNAFQRIVLVALKQGAEMTRHSVDGALSIQLLSGRLWLETEAQSFSIDAEEIAALQPGLSHSVYAEEEAMFLLTLAGNHEGEF
jgi:quercetin dioxygenase-like cupin family protein